MSSSTIKRLLTLILVSGLLWASAGSVHAQAVAEAGVFEDFEVRPGERFEVPVEVRAVENLYAIDIEIRFDPAILQAEDANPDKEGTQPALGTFLEAGLTLFNTIDNEEGLVRFTMTQVNPAEPKSGDGEIIVLYLVAQTEGSTDLEVSFLEASDRFGEAIILEPVDAEVRVEADAPEVTRTPVPVQDQDRLTPVPTLAATPTPTEAPPTPTATAELATEPSPQDAYPVETEVVTATPDLPDEEETEAAYPAETVTEPEPEPETETETETETAYPAEEEAEITAEQRGTILDYWWAVLIVVVLAAGLGVYLVVSRKRVEP